MGDGSDVSGAIFGPREFSNFIASIKSEGTISNLITKHNIDAFNMFNEQWRDSGYVAGYDEKSEYLAFDIKGVREEYILILKNLSIFLLAATDQNISNLFDLFIHKVFVVNQ